MPKSPVLVDSSYYIGMTRQGKNPLPLLTYLAVDRDLAVCGVIRAEVGRGIRIPKVRAAFHGFWDVMINVHTDNKLWQQAEDLAWKLDRSGKILPLTDIVIACCAMRLNATILTHDRHFLEIPGIRVAMSGAEL